ncbi:hypothetical protein FCULG_00001252 [Fusarium culmorum]|uniref:Cryptic loci regulator 2 N-terminal domain-containing protein n=1 Tax=Fusarium culmorum TaxID=5516 RepID=A0A2T4GLW3_FUSCU|nr:hypothetical protein FCULG_00001252 [Fusarium culmorum]
MLASSNNVLILTLILTLILNAKTTNIYSNTIMPPLIPRRSPPIPPKFDSFPLPLSSPALPPAALPNQASPQLNILTIVDHAVMIHSGGKWKVTNMDPQGPQENIAWQIPHSNHWLARISSQQANAELLSMVRPAEGNNIKRGYLSHDEGDGNVSVIICKIRITEQGRVQYLPGGVRPERVERFIPWLAMFMGFDSLHMPCGRCGCPLA